MTDFSEIKLEDKPYFDSYLNLYNPEISEMTFTNLFMWRNSYKFRYAEICGFLCIIAVPEYDKPFAFMPIGNISNDVFHEVIVKLKKYFNLRGWELVFKRVPESGLAHFSIPGKAENEAAIDRDSSDYIYLTNELIELKGKKFDGKRNHINKFKKQYEYEYVAMDESHIEECLRITREWCEERNCAVHKELYCEKKANTELLCNFTYLGCKGALIKVNGRFEAYTTGEMLNKDTAVIHIEKASSKINGLYTFVNQQFCENEWKDTVYINREQDIGIQGLRKAKLSYNPVKMVNKYSVIVRG